jgi:hypothetical protein
MWSGKIHGSGPKTPKARNSPLSEVAGIAKHLTITNKEAHALRHRHSLLFGVTVVKLAILRLHIPKANALLYLNLYLSLLSSLMLKTRRKGAAKKSYTLYPLLKKFTTLFIVYRFSVTCFKSLIPDSGKIPLPTTNAEGTELTSIWNRRYHQTPVPTNKEVHALQHGHSLTFTSGYCSIGDFAVPQKHSKCYIFIF